MMGFLGYRMHQKDLFNSAILALFAVTNGYCLIKAMRFIENPRLHAKAIRMSSYNPFLIVLFSYIYCGIARIVRQKQGGQLPRE